MNPMPVRARLLAVAVVASLVVLAGCGDSEPGPGPDTDAGPSSGRSLCRNANDYAWYLNYFGGAYGAPASPQEAKKIVPRLVDLSAALVDQVPDGRGAAAHTAHSSWVGIERIMRKYHYAEKNADKIVHEMTATLREDQESNRRFNGWLSARCGDGDGQFPSRPANAFG